MYKKVGILLLMAALTGCSEMGYMSSSAGYDGFTGYDPNTTVDNDRKGARVFPRYAETNGEKMFVFDPNAGAWAAYDQSGARVKVGRASGGKDFCPDTGGECRTASGTFRVQVKKGADCVSKTFPVGEGGASMPHCMFFHKGFAVHGSAFVPDQPSSHGCVRVLPSAAQWLHDDFMDVGTKVVVKPYNS